MSNRESRRDFFGRWLGKAEPPGPRGQQPSAPAPPAAQAEPAPGATSGFSLEAFYAARGPQRLPPISIRPSVLHYAEQITRVGSPPPHAPPVLINDPLYRRLAAGAASPDGPSQEASAHPGPATPPSTRSR